MIERIQKRLKPYKLKENNQIEMKAIIAGTTILFCGLLFQEDSDYDYPLFGTMAFLIIIFYNSYFILEWTYLFIASLKLKNRKIELILEIYKHLTCKNKADEYKTQSTEKGSQVKEK